MGRRVLVLEDDESLRLVISKALSRAGFEVRSTASVDTAIDRLAARDADALVADVLVGRDNFLDRIDELARLRPDAPVVVMSAQTTAATAIGAVKSGAYEYLPKPFDLNELVSILEKALDITGGGGAAPRQDAYPDLIGRSPAMQDAFRTVGRLAARLDPVLITGPEGSGRAAVARVIHRDSAVAGPLVEAGPHRLAEAGFEIFQSAAEGSLLLRRAEEWPDSTQTRVLEALETGPGSRARLLVTGALEAPSRLRPALLDRLAVGLVEMPPLRLRGDDRCLLFRHFLEEAGEGGHKLDASAEKFINSQVWPGEVSQLRRTARRLAAQGRRGLVTEADVAAAMNTGLAPDSDADLAEAAARFFGARAAAGDDAISTNAQLAVEAGLISAALEAAGGVRQEAAKALGMNRNTFARRLDALTQAGKLRPDGNTR